MRFRRKRVRHKPQYMWKCKCGWEGKRTARTAQTKPCPKCRRPGPFTRTSGNLDVKSNLAKGMRDVRRGKLHDHDDVKRDLFGEL